MLRLDAETIERWRIYEAASKAAADQYRDIPSSFNRAGFTATCTGGCGKTTANPGGTCRDCRKAKT